MIKMVLVEDGNVVGTKYGKQLLAQGDRVTCAGLWFQVLDVITVTDDQVTINVQHIP